MISQILTNQEIEKELEDMYLGKYVRYTRILFGDIVGMVDRIAYDVSKNPPQVIIIIDDLRFEEEADDIPSLLTLL